MSDHVCVAYLPDGKLCRRSARFLEPAFRGWVCEEHAGTEPFLPESFVSVALVRTPRPLNGYQAAQRTFTSAWHGLRSALRYERPGTFSSDLMERLIRELESSIISNSRIVARLYGVDTRHPFNLYRLIRAGEWAPTGKPLPSLGAYTPSLIVRKLAEVL